VIYLPSSLTLSFYDTTSSYFEGEGPSIAKHGKSRDHRPDKHQIVIGLLAGDEGIPIAHKVFEGDRADKTTVIETIDDLKKRFNLKRIMLCSRSGYSKSEGSQLHQRARLLLHCYPEKETS